MPLALSGAADSLGLTDGELAVACGSHHGEPDHIEAVEGLLEKAGLTEADLDNGPHPPMHAPSARRMLRDGETPRKTSGNCSGKHAGMLAVCVKLGWPTEGYRGLDHPLQTWIREIVARMCNISPEELLVGGDGCGAPAFALPLKSFATGFSRLATGERLEDDFASAALRLSAAMRSSPFMVSGTEGFDTEVMRETGLVAKGGADGVWAAGTRREGGWGFVLKISDGAQRAVRPASLAALAGRGVDLGGLRPGVPVLDLHEAVVGAMEPVSRDRAARKGE